MARFLVYLEPAEEGGYIVSAPALPPAALHKERRRRKHWRWFKMPFTATSSAWVSMVNRFLPAMRQVSSRLLKLKRLHEPSAGAQIL